MGILPPVVYRVYLPLYWGWLPRRSSNDCSRCAIAHNCTRISWHGHICLGWSMTRMALVGLKQSADALSASWRLIQFRWTIQSQWMSVVILASLLYIKQHTPSEFVLKLEATCRAPGSPAPPVFAMGKSSDYDTSHCVFWLQSLAMVK